MSLKQIKDPNLRKIFQIMCKIAGLNSNKINFKKLEQRNYTWTEAQEKKFKQYFTKQLKENKDLKSIFGIDNSINTIVNKFLELYGLRKKND